MYLKGLHIWLTTSKVMTYATKEFSNGLLAFVQVEYKIVESCLQFLIIFFSSFKRTNPTFILEQGCVHIRSFCS